MRIHELYEKYKDKYPDETKLLFLRFQYTQDKTDEYMITLIDDVVARIKSVSGCGLCGGIPSELRDALKNSVASKLALRKYITKEWNIGTTEEKYANLRELFVDIHKEQVYPYYKDCKHTFRALHQTILSKVFSKEPPTELVGEVYVVYYSDCITRPADNKMNELYIPYYYIHMNLAYGYNSAFNIFLEDPTTLRYFRNPVKVKTVKIPTEVIQKIHNTAKDLFERDALRPFVAEMLEIPAEEKKDDYW